MTFALKDICSIRPLEQMTYRENDVIEQMTQRPNLRNKEFVHHPNKYNFDYGIANLI